MVSNIFALVLICFGSHLLPWFNEKWSWYFEVSRARIVFHDVIYTTC